MKLRLGNQRCFRHTVSYIRARLRYLRDEFSLPLSVLLNILVRYPRIIEYRPDTVLQPRIQWLIDKGVPREKLNKVRFLLGSLEAGVTSVLQRHKCYQASPSADIHVAGIPEAPHGLCAER